VNIPAQSRPMQKCPCQETPQGSKTSGTPAVPSRLIGTLTSRRGIAHGDEHLVLTYGDSIRPECRWQRSSQVACCIHSSAGLRGRNPPDGAGTKIRHVKVPLFVVKSRHLWKDDSACAGDVREPPPRIRWRYHRLASLGRSVANAAYAVPVESTASPIHPSRRG